MKMVFWIWVGKIDYLHCKGSFAVFIEYKNTDNLLAATTKKEREKHVFNTISIKRRSRDSLLVRALVSWSKGCEFESRQERRENFLFQT